MDDKQDLASTDFHHAAPDRKVAAFLAYAKENVTPSVSGNNIRHKIAMTLASAIQYDEVEKDDLAGPIVDLASLDLDIGPEVVGQERFDNDWQELLALVSQIKE